MESHALHHRAMVQLACHASTDQGRWRAEEIRINGPRLIRQIRGRKSRDASAPRDLTTGTVLRKTLRLPRSDKALASQLLARLEHLASRGCHLTHSIGRSGTSALSKVLFEIPYQVDPHSSINANSFQYRRIVRRNRAFLVRSLLLACPN